MTERQQNGLSVDEALSGIETSWNRLMGAMTSWQVDDYTTAHDAAGWTALDHLAHVSAWERSRMAWLQGRPRHEGLSVSEAAFTQGYDPLNELVRQQTEGHGYDDVMAAARETHRQMIGTIRAFDPTVVDQGGITAVEAGRLGDELQENLADHYEDHCAYIEEILGSA